MSDLLLLCRIHFLKHFKIIIASCCVFTLVDVGFVSLLPQNLCRCFFFSTFFVVKTTLLTCYSIKRSWLASSWNSPFASAIAKNLHHSHMHSLTWCPTPEPRFTCFTANSVCVFVFTRMMRIFRNAAKWLIACCLCINANQVASTDTGITTVAPAPPTSIRQELLLDCCVFLVIFITWVLLSMLKNAVRN